MKKLIATIILMTATIASHASTKLVYSKAELEAANANNVPSIIDRYVTDTDRTSIITPNKVLFLLNGKPTTSVEPYLSSSDHVEVLSDGDSVVINVVTQ